MFVGAGDASADRVVDALPPPPHMAAALTLWSMICAFIVAPAAACDAVSIRRPETDNRASATLSRFGQNLGRSLRAL